MAVTVDKMMIMLLPDTQGDPDVVARGRCELINTSHRKEGRTRYRWIVLSPDDEGTYAQAMDLVLKNESLASCYDVIREGKMSLRLRDRETGNWETSTIRVAELVRAPVGEA